MLDVFENMWRKLSNRFFLGFFLSTMNMTAFSVCKLALDESFQQIDRKYDTCISYFLREKYLFFPRKNTNHILYDLKSPYVCFFYEEEASEGGIFTLIKII